MKTRWSTFLAVAFVAALFSLAFAGPAEAVCSGDDCGCNIDAEECRAACPPEGDPARVDCLRECRRESVICAKCCCCQCYLCAPQWGCRRPAPSAAAVPPADDAALFASLQSEQPQKCSAAEQDLGFLADGCAAPASDEPAEPDAPAEAAAAAPAD